MNRIEKIYRMRRNLLICAFICSFFLFFIMCFPKPFLSFPRSYPWRYLSKLHILFIFKTSLALTVVLLIFLLARYVLYKLSTLKDPVIRNAVDDERIRLYWLRAYRAAFFVMVGIHIIYLFSEGLMYGIGFPHAAWVSSTTGLMTFFGTALFYTREFKNEQS